MQYIVLQILVHKRKTMSQKPKKQTAITFRIDEDLAKQFKEIAENNNRTQSLLLRDFVIDYIKKNRQSSLKF